MIIGRGRSSLPWTNGCMLFLPIKAPILRVMNGAENFYQAKRRSCLASILLLSAVAFLTTRSHLFGDSRAGFPDGFDAVQAAPNSHRVLFENEFVRVLEVTLPPATTEPMHHHRWPSIFLNRDTGGRTAHLRYHLPDGSVRDIPAKETPVSESGQWRVAWMAPEAIHSLENIETVESASQLPKRPPTVRVEFKFHP